MDDMYNNQNGNNYQSENGYQEQLQYQYQMPRTELEEPMSMGEWMITLLIMMIPCANIVMMFVWAFGSKVKKSKSNYFKASLIFTAIQIVLAIIMLIVFSASMTSIADSMYY